MNEVNEASPASKAGDLERLVMHTKNGGEISGRGQYIGRIGNGRYFLCCDNEGCCDEYMDETELREYIQPAEDWKELPIRRGA